MRRPVLRRSVCTCVRDNCFGVVLAILIGGWGPRVAQAEVFTHIADIRTLDRKTADAGEPVDVTGVVTWSIPSSGFVVQDDTGGIWAQTKIAKRRNVWKGDANRVANLHPGAVVRIEGITSAGGFAPTIIPETVTLLGTRALPPAKPFDRARFFDGSESGERVEAEGTVVGFQPTSYGWGLRLEADPDILWVGVLRSVLPNPEKVLDQHVVVRGVAGTEFNSRGEFYSAIILVGAPSDFVVDPQQRGSSTLPLVALDQLRTFHPAQPTAHRVRIRGVATFVSHDRFIYLQQGDRAVRVNVSTVGTIKPGDRIEATGFVDMSSPTAELGGAEVTLLSHGKPIPAVSIDPEQIVRSATLATNQSEAVRVDYDGRLIQFTATLLGIDLPIDAADPTYRILIQQGKLVLNATSSGRAAAALAKLSVGSELQIAGIVQMEFPAMGGAKLGANTPQLDVLIRDPRDVVVRHAPSWWTARRLAGAVAIVICAFVLAIGWIWQLRRQVRRKTSSLEKEIKERIQMEREVERTHQALMLASRQAGMAEVATNVLHNVGNALNSVNVSVTVAIEKVQQIKFSTLEKLAELLRNHAHVPDFLGTDPKGKRTPEFLTSWAGNSAEVQKACLTELESMRQSVDHIKEIVAMQQSYSRLAGVAEEIKASAVFEEAIRMNSAALQRHGIALRREYQDDPTLLVEKHNVLQILVNLIQNAKEACSARGDAAPEIVLRIRGGTPDTVQFEVSDNGVGIAPENLTRIFSHGFTTRTGGHGFGLHSGANTAKAMGGSLNARSAGIGAGAEFVLEIPVRKK